MQSRNKDGIVKWKCSKCNIVFEYPCGQDFWQIGTITLPFKETPFKGGLVGKWVEGWAKKEMKSEKRRSDKN
jgi:hypothetical protein